MTNDTDRPTTAKPPDKRGGKRKGAGRKKLDKDNDKATIMVGVRLKEKQHKRLKKQPGTISDAIRAAIDSYYKIG